jgi:hypothetical protein
MRYVGTVFFHWLLVTSVLFLFGIIFKIFTTLLKFKREVAPAKEVTQDRFEGGFMDYSVQQVEDFTGVCADCKRKLHHEKAIEYYNFDKKLREHICRECF